MRNSHFTGDSWRYGILDSTVLVVNFAAGALHIYSSPNLLRVAAHPGRTRHVPDLNSSSLRKVSLTVLNLQWSAARMRALRISDSSIDHILHIEQLPMQKAYIDHRGWSRQTGIVHVSSNSRNRDWNRNLEPARKGFSSHAGHFLSFPYRSWSRRNPFHSNLREEDFGIGTTIGYFMDSAIGSNKAREPPDIVVMWCISYGLIDGQDIIWSQRR